MMAIVLLFLATLFVAYANGANDNFKGVATLFGSQTTPYKIAIAWATFTTFLGSVASIFLANTLIKNFSGKGLVPDAIANGINFHLAVAIATGLTVILATLTGFPISTTHALTGGLVGAGLVAIGLKVNFAALGSAFVVPLLLSPIVAIVSGLVLYGIFRSVEKRFSFRQQLIDSVHFLSAGVVSFARGLNDTPKIVALLLITNGLSIQGGMAIVAVGMAVGGLLNARKVAETMSRKISAMNHGQGLTANLVTGILVIAASRYGLPVSTTHVSVGSIFGSGLLSKTANPRVFYQILLSWLLTLPISALLAGAAYWIFQRSLSQ